jgi:hypothetical protein
MQAGQKYTRCFANSISDHRALLQLEIESMISCGTSSSFSASGISSSAGKPQSHPSPA